MLTPTLLRQRLRSRARSNPAISTRKFRQRVQRPGLLLSLLRVVLRALAVNGKVRFASDSQNMLRVGLRLA